MPSSHEHSSPLAIDAPVADPHAATAMRLEALGLLAGGVAHDFNNILAVIRANVELAREALRSRSPDVPVALSDLGEVDRAVERASDLVRQLLAFGRRQRLAPEPLDLNVVVRETLALVRVLLGETVQLVVRPAPDLPRVRADRPQIEQVLVSLVLNGRDAILEAGPRNSTLPPGGTLTVSTRVVEIAPDHVARMGVPHAGPYACVQVRDDGIGMDAATRARIFEPFFTTKAIDRGAGLGLAATWGIVRQSGGAIHVDSEPGVGSTFTVYLPATDPSSLATADAASQAVTQDPPAAAPIAATGTAAATSESADQVKRVDGLTPEAGPTSTTGTRDGSGITVLLAEDDHAVRRATSRILRGAGYEVLEAGDGRSALGLWRARATEIDVLVADLRMPHMRGDALARAVRTDDPVLPVVLMSGFGEDPAMRSTLAGGPSDSAGAAYAPESVEELPVLAKPFGAAELLGRVAAALAAVEHERQRNPR